jgi:hypothetical protein
LRRLLRGGAAAAGGHAFFPPLHALRRSVLCPDDGMEAIANPFEAPPE